MLSTSKSIILFCLLFLSSCGLSKSTCQEGDWFGIGLRDGRQGQLPSKLEQHIKSCAKHEVAPNLTLWEQGRQQGLKQYCTPQNAYNVGANGFQLKQSCPAELSSSLYAAHSVGQNYYNISQDIADLENKKRDLYAQLDRDPISGIPKVSEQSIYSRLSFITLRIALLRARLLQNAHY
jgi:hypothetical protein